MSVDAAEFRHEAVDLVREPCTFVAISFLGGTGFAAEATASI